MLAQRFPQLSHRLPPKRKLWNELIKQKKTCAFVFCGKFLVIQEFQCTTATREILNPSNVGRL